MRTVLQTVAQNCLDKFWSDQKVMYDYKADLRGT